MTDLTELKEMAEEKEVLVIKRMVEKYNLNPSLMTDVKKALRTYYTLKFMEKKDLSKLFESEKDKEDMNKLELKEQRIKKRLEEKGKKHLINGLKFMLDRQKIEALNSISKQLEGKHQIDLLKEKPEVDKIDGQEFFDKIFGVDKDEKND